MHLHIGTDHAGFELKNRLVASLRAKGHEVTGSDQGVYPKDMDFKKAYTLQFLPKGQ